MITHSETLEKLAVALAKAQATMAGAKKDAANPFFKSKYADLASVWEAIRTPLTENGLSVVQTASEHEPGTGVVAISTMLLHESGQWIRDTLTMKAKENSPQGIGSAITYGRRYGLSAIAGVAPEDDDGEAAQGRSARTSAKSGDDVTAKFKVPSAKPNIITPAATITN